MNVTWGDILVPWKARKTSNQQVSVNFQILLSYLQQKVDPKGSHRCFTILGRPFEFTNSHRFSVEVSTSAFVSEGLISSSAAIALGRLTLQETYPVSPPWDKEKSSSKGPCCKRIWDSSLEGRFTSTRKYHGTGSHGQLL